MLGDFEHSSPLPYKSIVSLLEEWVKEIKNGKSKDYDIILVLEADSQEVSILKQFLLTGNWETLINYWLPYNTLEWLEFCSNIRSIYNTIGKLNSSNKLPKINFDIYGGEEGNVFNTPKYLSYSISEGSKYFINQRDSITAHNIITYLNKYRNRKAIIFYGNLHLQKAKVDKNISGTLPNSESWGYYLAYYLKQEFGDKAVLAVNQYIVNKKMIDNSPFYPAGNSNIFVYSQDIPWPNIQPQNYDAFILRHEKPLPGHSLGNIFSINIIKADINRMEYMEKYFPGNLAEGYYNIARQSLQLLTGRNYWTTKEWENWAKENKYNGISRLESKEFKQELFNLYFNNSTDVNIKWQLYSLGFGEDIISKNQLSESEWERAWTDALPKIKYLNWIGLYWIGTKKEKLYAKNNIDKFIGTTKYSGNYQPEEYLKIYRKIFDNVDY
jgi:hypothetical protein